MLNVSPVSRISKRTMNVLRYGQIFTRWYKYVVFNCAIVSSNCNLYNLLFSSGKASSGTNTGRVPLRKTLPAVAEKGNAQQEWIAFLAPRLPPPFKQLPLPKLPCSCLRLLCSLLDDLLLLLLIPHCFTFSLNPTFLDASAALLTTSSTSLLDA